jgi:uncharacterized protein (DUF302 family)
MNPEVTVNQVEHIRISTERSFAEVVRRLEAATGVFEMDTVRRLAIAGAAPDVINEAIDRMAGKSGFMRFAAWDHGAILRQMGHTADAVRFAIGHPLIAARMTRHRISSGLYAPLSVLVAGEEAGGATIEYDRPSSLLQQFNDAGVMETAYALDDKLAALVDHAAFGEPAM